MIKNVLYTSQAKSDGGRNGIITSENGMLQVKLKMQMEEEGTSPEQLFAAGYAASFDSTLHLMADRAGIKLKKTSVNALVDFGTTSEGGYEIAAKLQVHLPGVGKKDADNLIALSHQHCPYSKAVKDNIRVSIEIV